MAAFRKITNYLFETTLDNYEEHIDKAKQYFIKYNPKLGACSSVQNGKLRGRNYDWTFDEEPEFVIHVPANAAGRHASIGVAATTAVTAADVESGEHKPVLDFIPYCTLDGINDAGLCININVVGYEEKGEYVMKTEEVGDDVCPLMVPRLLLDGAASIEEALDMMRKMDIFSLGTQEEAHYMISGPTSAKDPSFDTVVVELIPDENKHYTLSVIDHNKGDFVDNKPIMTNFHLTGFDGSIKSMTAHPMGYERYLLLHDNFEQGGNVQGMLDLMKKVFFSRSYDLYIDNFWYSDHPADGVDMSNRGEPKLNGDLSRAGAYADTLKAEMELYNNMKRDSKKWHTVHTSVYDMEEKKLFVMPQESGYAFDFTL